MDYSEQIKRSFDKDFIHTEGGLLQVPVIHRGMTYGQPTFVNITVKTSERKQKPFTVTIMGVGASIGEGDTPSDAHYTFTKQLLQFSKKEKRPPGICLGKKIEVFKKYAPKIKYIKCMPLNHIELMILGCYEQTQTTVEG